MTFQKLLFSLVASSESIQLNSAYNALQQNSIKFNEQREISCLVKRAKHKLFVRARLCLNEGKVILFISKDDLPLFKHGDSATSQFAVGLESPKNYEIMSSFAYNIQIKKAKSKEHLIIEMYSLKTSSEETQIRTIVKKCLDIKMESQDDTDQLFDFLKRQTIQKDFYQKFTECGEAVTPHGVKRPSADFLICEELRKDLKHKKLVKRCKKSHIKDNKQYETLFVREAMRGLTRKGIILEEGQLDQNQRGHSLHSLFLISEIFESSHFVYFVYDLNIEKENLVTLEDLLLQKKYHAAANAISQYFLKRVRTSISNPARKLAGSMLQRVAMALNSVLYVEGDRALFLPDPYFSPKISSQDGAFLVEVLIQKLEKHGGKNQDNKLFSILTELKYFKEMAGSTDKINAFKQLKINLEKKIKINDDLSGFNDSNDEIPDEKGAARIPKIWKPKKFLTDVKIKNKPIFLVQTFGNSTIDN